MTHPLSWYVSKIEAGEPFTSLLYGDGEWFVCMRERTGQTMAYGEVVTKSLEDELLASLTVAGDDIVRGTDLNLIHYEGYQGGDRVTVVEIGQRIERFLAAYPDLSLVDGTVWETAQQAGEWAPLIKALRGRPLVLVGNPALVKTRSFLPARFIPVPATNAAARLAVIEGDILQLRMPPDTVYLLCCGLGAIPLALRLRRLLPGATFLDMGSNFDLFVGLPTRRWRMELYADPARLREVIARNLEGME